MSMFRSLARNQPPETPEIAPTDPWWEPPPLTDPALLEAKRAAAIPLERRHLIVGGPVDTATIHLLLLRAFIAFAWLRAVSDKLGHGEWWNGEAVSEFLSGGAAADPMSGFSTLSEVVLIRIAMPVGWIIILLEIAIGLAVLTGFQFDVALGVGIGLAAVFIMGGEINPAAFYIIIQLVLIGSPAGRVYRIDLWERPSVLRWAPWAGGMAAAITIWGLLAADSITTGSVEDPAAVLTFLGFFGLLTTWLLWHHAWKVQDAPIR